MRQPTDTQLGGARGAARRSSTAPRTLHLIMGLLDVTDAKLARRLDVSRQTVHARRTGRSAMTLDDIEEVADALDVEPALFLGPPHEAVRWLVEHRPDLLNGATALEHKGCIIVAFPAGRASTRRAIMPVPVGAGASTGVSAVAA